MSPTSSSNKKNKVKELTSALIGTATNKKSKNASDNGDDKLSATEKEIYRFAGKKAVVLLDPFTVPEQAFNTGIQHDMGGQILSIASPETIEKHLHFYHGILRLVPSLQSDLDHDTMTPSRLRDIVQAITTGMSEGRSTDLASVKHKGMKYVPENMNSVSDTLDPPIPEVESKSMRGVFHPQLARFLCPRRDLEEFDQDPECGMEALAQGVFPMKASRWPTGFYQDDVYDPKDNTIGLFRNHVVVRFYKHLFLGPAAVVNESTTRRAARPAKNRGWGLDSVDRHIIAYVHIITYFTLSHAQQWSQTVGEMDLEDLYSRIVEMLEDESDLWVRETLAWWNKHCNPGSGPSKPLNGKNAKKDRAGSDDDMTAIRARRAKGKEEAAAEDPFCSEPEPIVPRRAPTAKPKRPEYDKATHKSSTHADEDIDIPEAQFRNNAPRPSVARPKRSEFEAAPEKSSSRPWVESDEDNDIPEAQFRNNAPRPSVARPKRSEFEAAPEKSSSRPWVESDEDNDIPEAQFRNNAPRPSVSKPKRSEYEAAPKTVSTYANEDIDIPEAPSRNRDNAPRPSVSKPKRFEYEVAPSSRADEDIDIPEAPSRNRDNAPHPSVSKPKRSEYEVAPSSRADEDINLPEVPSRNCTPRPSVAKLKRSEYKAAPKKSSNPSDEDDSNDGGVVAHTDSQLSQLPDDINSAEESARGVPPKRRRVHLKLSQPPGTTKDGDDVAPPPKKAKKSTKPKPQIAPAKRNPVRGKRANGF
ncbi:hypothetical protein JVU11DRAFT_3978 [Chiua virens]|nr:hypothetical protein JVU11DRAFT_3978 [Chiua virens]